MPEIPRKPYYKPSEVCALTDTQPYVLRFWESEFPQLASSKGVYRRKDIDLILRIKQMLNEEDCSIAQVRSALGAEGNGKAGAREDPGPQPAPPRKKKTSAPSKPTRAKAVLPFADGSSTSDVVPRSRYEGALDEVAHLRLELQEAEAARRKAESGTNKALEENQRIRERADAAITQIEQLIARLS